MLDRDLAELYGVKTKRLNEQVKRNRDRFPDDFMFQLTKDERDKPVANCDRFKTLKHSTSFPYAFTEHGALMLANVIKSPTAIEMSIVVVRTFAKLREMPGRSCRFKEENRGVREEIQRARQTIQNNL